MEPSSLGQSVWFPEGQGQWPPNLVAALFSPKRGQAHVAGRTLKSLSPAALPCNPCASCTHTLPSAAAGRGGGRGRGW